MPDIVILAGPNGAGKTTAARSLLPGRLGITQFVNADEIARGLSPFDWDGVVLTAGRLMLERIEELLRRRQDFAFETTLSGRSHAGWLGRAREDGWRIILIYLWLPKPEDAMARVTRRVSEGGHAIPPDVIRRRHAAGMSNLVGLYMPLADAIAIYDNSDSGRRLIAQREPGQPLAILDEATWQTISSARPSPT